MLIRTISSIAGLPILIALVLYGGLSLKIAIFLISVIGMYELYGALGVRNRVVSVPAYFAAAYYVFFIDITDASGIVFIISLFILAIMAILVLTHEKANIFDGAAVVFGFFYICVLLSNVYLIRHNTNGVYIVWIVFIAAWGCDTGAYLTGKAIGKHKLTPKLSPNKTIEGSIGGVFLATVLSLLYGFCISRIFKAVDMNIIILSGIIGFFGSIFSQFGDLFASAIKRHTGIKDYGHLIPGHGGIIDRFDSILVTAPTVYCLMLILFRFF